MAEVTAATAPPPAVTPETDLISASVNASQHGLNGNTAEPKHLPEHAGDAENAVANNTLKPTFTVGVAADVNRRCRRTMEDAHAHQEDFGGVTGQGFFAIYDGHAGKQAAEWCSKHLHTRLAEHVTREKERYGAVDMAELLDRVFVETDQELVGEKGINSGCTAVVSVLLRGKGAQRTLYTANVGDARAVLCRNGKAIRLTHDHKGNDPQEIKRVIDAGGFIMNGRVNGVLAVTRALGDASMKDLVTSRPFTTKITLEESDDFLILACDGIWDVAEDQAVVDLVRPVQDSQEAAAQMVQHALKNSSTDNLSAMVIRFSK